MRLLTLQICLGQPKTPGRSLCWVIFAWFVLFRSSSGCFRNKKSGKVLSVESAGWWWVKLLLRENLLQFWGMCQELEWECWPACTGCAQLIFPARCWFVWERAFLSGNVAPGCLDSWRLKFAWLWDCAGLSKALYLFPGILLRVLLRGSLVVGRTRGCAVLVAAFGECCHEAHEGWSLGLLWAQPKNKRAWKDWRSSWRNWGCCSSVSPPGDPTDTVSRRDGEGLDGYDKLML